MSIGSVCSSTSTSSASFAASAQGSRKHHGPSEQDLTNALQTAGVSDSDIPDILQQIQDAVSSARQNGDVQPGSIRTAVNGVLQANGVDVQAFDQALQAGRPDGPPPGGGKGPPPPRDGVSSLSSAGLSDDQISAFLTQV